MSDKTDQVKGRVKEAAGDLTDNDDLKREGKADRLGGEVKEKLGDLKDRAADATDNVKDKVTEVLHKN